VCLMRVGVGRFGFAMRIDLAILGVPTLALSSSRFDL
jgi:hypothetical protein